jgi:hypothetical protein
VSVSGSFTDIRNTPNSSTGIPPSGAAVHVTERTVRDAESRSSLVVHPGLASVCTAATLVRSRVSLVVAAPVVDSLGTWKVTSAVLPRTASLLLAWTCADAVVIPAVDPR